MAELQQKLEILRTQIASVSVTTTSAQLTQTQPELKQQDPEKEKVEIKEQPNVSPVVA
jgi:hypothetical protein